MSSSYQARPWRADTGWAWWLLCQPSPKLSSATHQLLRGIVARDEAARAPQVRGRVHQPRGVQAERRAEEHAPQHVGEAAEGEQREADHHLRNPVPGGHRDVELVLAQVRHVALEDLRVVVHGLAGHDPAHVRPEGALARRVRIAVVIRVLMMDAVRGHPEDRPALERERAAGGEEVLHPLGRLVSAVRQQAVVAHADAPAARDVPEEGGGGDRAPVEVEERGDGTDVVNRHCDDGHPVDALGYLAAVDLRRSDMSHYGDEGISRRGWVL